MNQSNEQKWLKELLVGAQQIEEKTIERTEELVRIESPSHDKQAVDRAGDRVAAWCTAAGGAIHRHHHQDFGDSLEVSFGPRDASSRPVMLLGHLDTVWDKGTIRTMPWKVDAERLNGPGVLDMKLGVVMALSAVELLTAQGGLPRPVVLLLHGDEEVGSIASRPVTEQVAGKCSEVFVLEPAQGNNAAYKTMRKGVGNYRLDVKGIAAHSGVDFERGHSAVLELARQLERLSTFSDGERGLTVNAGVIGGGTRSNVIAAHAWAEIDVRIARKKDAALIEKKLRSLKAHDKECQVTLSGGINRPPMERTEEIARLFHRARGLAAQMNGFELEEAATGGGSDGNFTAALGVPTLDGMGAVGAGAHADHEHAVRAYIAPRTALLAAMLR